MVTWKDVSGKKKSMKKLISCIFFLIFSYSFYVNAITYEQAFSIADERASAVCTNYEIINQLKDYSKKSNGNGRVEFNSSGGGRYFVRVWSSPVLELYFACPDQTDFILANSNTFEYNCNSNWQGIDKKTNQITGTSVDPVTFKLNFEQQRYFSKFNETEFIDLVDDPSFVSFDGSKLIVKEVDIGDGMIATITLDFENDEVVVWPKDTTGYLKTSCSPNYELLKTINKITKKDDIKKELLLASVNEKRDLCFSMGFEENTEGLANCILQLMLHENKNPKTKEQTVVITTESNNNQQTNIMSEQTRIMQRQLELQELQNSQKMMKTFQYMMDFGKMPPLGYGY